MRPARVDLVPVRDCALRAGLPHLAQVLDREAVDEAVAGIDDNGDRIKGDRQFDKLDLGFGAGVDLAHLDRTRGGDHLGFAAAELGQTAAAAADTHRDRRVLLLFAKLGGCHIAD